MMDLIKVFGRISHDVHITRMQAYDLRLDYLVFFYSYLKREERSVKSNNIRNLLKVILSGAPQESIVGLILFNIFIKDLFPWIEQVEIENQSDVNTIPAFTTSMPELTSILESESDEALNCFKNNGMAANSDKLHSIIINHCVTQAQT